MPSTIKITDEMTETFRDFFYNNPGGAGDSPIQLALQAWVERYFSTEPVVTMIKEQGQTYVFQGGWKNAPAGMEKQDCTELYAFLPTSVAATEPVSHPQENT